MSRWKYWHRILLLIPSNQMELFLLWNSRNLYEYNTLLPVGTQEEYEFVRKNVFDILDSAKDESDISKLKMQLMSLQYQLPDNKLLRGYGMKCPFISSNEVIEQSSLQSFECAVFGFHIAITLYGSKSS